ncbi:VOC family protein [Streptomyces sp. NPDC050508]|uniref:VOC family protein n=1 Tax=Streptomyces sp. NPDC050508 TaxID=3155405 RepID=UPI00344A8B5F
MLHHVELWVPNLGRAVTSWGWLLESLGYEPHQNWAAGRSWRMGRTYIVVEESPALRGNGHGHDRMLPGLNHLAFHVPGDRTELDALVAAHGKKKARARVSAGLRPLEPDVRGLGSMGLESPFRKGAAD